MVTEQYKEFVPLWLSEQIARDIRISGSPKVAGPKLKGSHLEPRPLNPRLPHLPALPPCLAVYYLSTFLDILPTASYIMVLCDGLHNPLRESWY
jgi:hypothetical protein